MMNAKPTMAECLTNVYQASDSCAEGNCLYRGEDSLYPTTYSSHYRLFFKSNRFTDSQTQAVKERLLIIAQMMEVIGLGKPLFSSETDGAKHVEDSSFQSINEVIYCFMQHYHLATPFIDLTTDIEIAAAFATFGAAKENPSKKKQGVIYLLNKSELENNGYRITASGYSKARRPIVQKAVSLFLDHDTDFQMLPTSVISRFEFEDTCDNLSRYDKPEIYNALNDKIAEEVARLSYRCAYGDLASDDPSHGRVSKYFEDIAYLLADAGAIPRS
ncbi:FRG domain-containing protein [Mucilaginibacter sp. ZT4R22]|uniref:FRG domain-containing protein n=1 Tax=Mucilaginibacter pankratovii TaxID=2772110 RepID=A0ABR7WYU4_9SPHI|nr:FRG domain-containing protein [Mucilaginibacter pankratovii]MBD1367461.1 FRG domain-containing protein [Mucilaginibacter pankratovii]